MQRKREEVKHQNEKLTDKVSDRVSEIGDRVSEIGGAIGSKISDIGGEISTLGGSVKSFLSSKFQSEEKEQNVMGDAGGERLNVEDELVIIEAEESKNTDIVDTNEQTANPEDTRQGKTISAET